MTEEELRSGQLFLIDKPQNWTSFDVVNKMRWRLRKHFGIKKIKVGHAGTLDPLATGLLVICAGKKTKEIPNLTGVDKTYTGTFLLGKTTPCYDLEMDFNAEFPTEHIDEKLLEETRLSFLGDQEQIPPVHSAKQVDGKRAYDLARAGKEVELKPNKIRIEKFEIDNSRFPEIDFEISCSKGTYIRSIANDFGAKLNSGATLVALRRTASGDLHINNAQALDEWLNDFASDAD